MNLTIEMVEELNEVVRREVETLKREQKTKKRKRMRILIPEELEEQIRELHEKGIPLKVLKQIVEETAFSCEQPLRILAAGWVAGIEPDAVQPDIPFRAPAEDEAVPLSPEEAAKVPKPVIHAMNERPPQMSVTEWEK